MVIRVVYGTAGTGKTFVLVKEAEQLISRGRKVVILCPTHSSKRNIKERCSLSNVIITTYFAFYRINYRTMNIIGYVDEPDNLLFDEFSMIDRELFKSMMQRTSSKIDITLYGDPAQLNPVGCSRSARISMSMLKRCMDDHMSYQLIYHYVGSVFSTKQFRRSKKYKLTVNHRANEKIGSVIRELFFNSGVPHLDYIGRMTVEQRMRTGEWTLIASTYQSLESVYEAVSECSENNSNRSYDVIVKCCSSVPHLRQLYFSNGERFFVGENTDDFTNGEIVVAEVLGDGSVVLTSEDTKRSSLYRGEISLLPLRFLSAHKSQGMTIPRVIVCVDKLFEPSLLYTMVTRASIDVCFYREESNDDEVIRHLRETNTLLAYYGYSISSD